MLSIHSGGEIPGVFRVEGVADDDFPGSIRATLLEVVTLCDLVIVMAGPAGFPRTIRNFAFQAQAGSIKSLEDDLFVQGNLGGKRDWVKDKKR